MNVNTEKWAYQPCIEIQNNTFKHLDLPCHIYRHGDLSLVTKYHILQAHRETSTVILCTFLMFILVFKMVLLPNPPII